MRGGGTIGRGALTLSNTDEGEVSRKLEFESGGLLVDHADPPENARNAVTKNRKV